MSYWEVNTTLTLSASKKCAMKYRDESIFETKKEYVSDNLSLSFSSVFRVTQKQYFVIQNQNQAPATKTLLVSFKSQTLEIFFWYRVLYTFWITSDDEFSLDYFLSQVAKGKSKHGDAISGWPRLAPGHQPPPWHNQAASAGINGIDRGACGIPDFLNIIFN